MHAVNYAARWKEQLKCYLRHTAPPLIFPCLSPCQGNLDFAELTRVDGLLSSSDFLETITYPNWGRNGAPIIPSQQKSAAQGLGFCGLLQWEEASSRLTTIRSYDGTQTGLFSHLRRLQLNASTNVDATQRLESRLGGVSRGLLRRKGKTKSLRRFSVLQRKKKKDLWEKTKRSSACAPGGCSPKRKSIELKRILQAPCDHDGGHDYEIEGLAWEGQSFQKTEKRQEALLTLLQRSQRGLFKKEGFSSTRREEREGGRKGRKLYKKKGKKGGREGRDKYKKRKREGRNIKTNKKKEGKKERRKEGRVGRKEAATKTWFFQAKMVWEHGVLHKLRQEPSWGCGGDTGWCRCPIQHPCPPALQNYPCILFWPKPETTKHSGLQSKPPSQSEMAGPKPPEGRSGPHRPHPEFQVVVEVPEEPPDCGRQVDDVGGLVFLKEGRGLRSIPGGGKGRQDGGQRTHIPKIMEPTPRPHALTLSQPLWRTQISTSRPTAVLPPSHQDPFLLFRLSHQYEFCREEIGKYVGR
ncbi:hypothetical protein L345_14443, partial [Ophiophagus hannah]